MLALQARNGTDLPNEPDVPIRPGDAAIALDQFRALVVGATPLTDPSPHYNCFGLVFAARRTNLGLPTCPLNIQDLLGWDGYSRTANAQVGDVVVYRDRSSDEIDHVGLVVDTQPLMSGGNPNIRVWSMWGGLGEFLHSLAGCPYGSCDVEYWRLTR